MDNHPLHCPAGAPVDFRELLMKYIEHVGECEGSIFIDGRRRHHGVIWTDAEWEALEMCAEDSHLKYRPNLAKWG